MDSENKLNTGIKHIESREPMLKVLHLINYPGKGGSERYILSLAERLHNRECMFYLGYSMNGPMLEQVKELGIQAFHFPMGSPYDFKAAKRLAALCRLYSIDVVHTHFLRENYVSIFSRFFGNRAKLVNTSHLITEKSLALRLSNRLLTRFDGSIIAVCAAGREQMIAEGLSPRKIEVIYNGVDVDYWSERICSNIRKELGIGEDDFVITSAGRFTEEKGHRFLIESIKTFRDMSNACSASESSGCNGSAADTLQKIRFILAGDGELLEECRDLAEAYGVSEYIIFPGFRNDIRNILKGSDLYVSPSKSEAMSLSIIEALAAGLPVIATNVGGAPEIINDQNGCGALVEYGDTESFAGAVLMLLQDRDFYNKCRDKAYKTAREKFNLDNTARETYNLYIRLLKK